MTLTTGDFTVFASNAQESESTSYGEDTSVLSSEDDSEQKADVEDTTEPENETADYLVTVSWLDGGNALNRRPEDISKLIEIYADGVRMDEASVSFEVLNKDTDGDGVAEPESLYGSERYYYVVSGLSVYKDTTDTDNDTKEKITYTAKENADVISGYTEADAEKLVLNEEEPKGEFLAPDAELTLLPYDKTEDKIVKDTGDKAD